jgi:hypothetical protein
MPATLREAAQVVHDLGIRYLWVDALCILQGGSDDVEAHADWKRESAGMAKVFGNAYLTIVAAGSSDCGGGLIPEPIWTMAERVTGESESVVSFGRQPLFTRAWAQQEWLLSSRLLVFTDTRMHFVCNVWEAPARHASHKLRLPDLRAGPYDKNWKTILIDFSARNLTRPSDKLPAISGLAKLYSDIADGTLGDYYAGLWQAHLVKDLVWRVDEPGRHYAMWFPLTNRLGRSIVNSRPRAPSWSWAAVDGPISFIGKGPIFATVIHCYTEPSPGCDQFGEVMFGLLVIRCPFFTASLKGENTDQLTLEGDTGESCLFWIDDPREVYQLLQH